MSQITDEVIDHSDELKELASRHSVCYEFWPEYDLDGEKQVKVGYSLELYGTHDHGSSTLTPGCDLCLATYRDLRRVAEWMLPRDERPSRYQIEPFDYAMHQSPQRKLLPEVELAVKILHRQNARQPIDACKERCLKEMQDKLRSIGIFRGK